jgi:hypothetical protein
VEKPLRTLSPLLGQVQADLEELFATPLKDYLDRLRERSQPSGPKIINDPLWHTVRVNSWEIALLDSPVVQRLRNIGQLGLASYVYPGAGYSRFEHTLGVLHQTQRFIEAINRNAHADGVEHLDPIQQDDEIALRLAALLHDVGHGFLSHVSERAMMRLPVGETGDTSRQVIRAAKNHWVCKGNPALAEVIAALIVTSSKLVELFDVVDVPRWRHNSYGLTEKSHALLSVATPFQTGHFWARSFLVLWMVTSWITCHAIATWPACRCRLTSIASSKKSTLSRLLLPRGTRSTLVLRPATSSRISPSIRRAAEALRNW